MVTPIAAKSWHDIPLPQQRFAAIPGQFFFLAPLFGFELEMRFQFPKCRGDAPAFVDARHEFFASLGGAFLRFVEGILIAKGATQIARILRQRRLDWRLVFLCHDFLLKRGQYINLE